MSWDPKIYLAFAPERTRPAVDLLARVPLAEPERIADLGCGPGNSTQVLRARYAQAAIDGVESSQAMLEKARQSGIVANWIKADVETWTPRAAPDLLFSNATLQWVEGHERLVPRLMGFVAAGGALAFQMPRNFDAPSHALMRAVADEGPWASKLKAVRRITIPPPSFYYDLLAPSCATLDIWETTYLHVLDGEDPVFRWVSGTGLRPFADALQGHEREAFLEAYRARLAHAYPRRADGKTLLPFKRIFVVAMK